MLWATSASAHGISVGTERAGRSGGRHSQDEQAPRVDHRARDSAAAAQARCPGRAVRRRGSEGRAGGGPAPAASPSRLAESTAFCAGRPVVRAGPLCAGRPVVRARAPHAVRSRLPRHSLAPRSVIAGLTRSPALERAPSAHACRSGRTLSTWARCRGWRPVFQCREAASNIQPASGLVSKAQPAQPPGSNSSRTELIHPDANLDPAASQCRRSTAPRACGESVRTRRAVPTHGELSHAAQLRRGSPVSRRGSPVSQIRPRVDVPASM